VAVFWGAAAVRGPIGAGIVVGLAALAIGCGGSDHGQGKGTGAAPTAKRGQTDASANQDEGSGKLAGRPAQHAYFALIAPVYPAARDLSDLMTRDPARAEQQAGRFTAKLREATAVVPRLHMTGKAGEDVGAQFAAASKKALASVEQIQRGGPGELRCTKAARDLDALTHLIGVVGIELGLIPKID
jgi:hypothetical protein